MRSAPQSDDQRPEPDRVAPRVLLAEDDSGFRSLLATVLADSGCDVVQAVDGQQLLDLVAVELAESPDARRFDLIIMDVKMPHCSGTDVLELIRCARLPTPVIVITAFGDAQLHHTAYELGAWVFDKPFDLEDFEDTVAALIKRRRRAARRALPQA